MRGFIANATYIRKEYLMDKKLIFFDIDGTLLDHEKRLPTSTKLAIETLKERGHEVAIATGRAPFMFKELREELDIPTYVSLNGQYVVHNDNVVFKNPLDYDELHQLTIYAGNREHPVIFEHHEQMYTNIEFHRYIEEGIGSLKIKNHPVFDPRSYHEQEMYQTLLFCTEAEEDEYRKRFGKFEFVRWHEYGMDVMPKGGSKARGIQALIEHLNIPMENVYAFGDGLNDLQMLTYVPNGIAMGNASDNVKHAAKYITDDVDNDGILKGLVMVGLLEMESVIYKKILT
jgi:Cof subfamily protein (haloacid dehalogenase superfamily)